MATKIIRLTEEDIHNMVLEASLRYLNEMKETEDKKDAIKRLNELVSKTNEERLKFLPGHLENIMKCFEGDDSGYRFDSISRNRDKIFIGGNKSYIRRMANNMCELYIQQLNTKIWISSDTIDTIPPIMTTIGDYAVTAEVKGTNLVKYQARTSKFGKEFITVSSNKIKYETCGNSYSVNNTLLNAFSRPKNHEKKNRDIWKWLYRMSNEIFQRGDWDKFVENIESKYNGNQNNNNQNPNGNQGNNSNSTFDNVPFDNFEDGIFIAKSNGSNATPVTQVSGWSSNLMNGFSAKDGWGQTNTGIPFFKKTENNGSLSYVVFFNANLSEGEKDDIGIAAQKFKYKFSNKDLQEYMFNCMNGNREDFNYDTEQNQDDYDDDDFEAGDDEGNNEGYQQPQPINQNQQQNNEYQNQQGKQEFQNMPYNYEKLNLRRIKNGRVNMNDYNQEFKP
jgi:hypothetical protein